MKASTADARKFEVSDFTLTHTRQLSATVTHCYDVWGNGFSSLESTTVHSVFSPTREVKFWFPANADFPEVLREAALESVHAAWADATR